MKTQVPVTETLHLSSRYKPIQVKMYYFSWQSQFVSILNDNKDHYLQQRIKYLKTQRVFYKCSFPTNFKGVLAIKNCKWLFIPLKALYLLFFMWNTNTYSSLRSFNALKCNIISYMGKHKTIITWILMDIILWGKFFNHHYVDDFRWV